MIYVVSCKRANTQCSSFEFGCLINLKMSINTVFDKNPRTYKNPNSNSNDCCRKENPGFWDNCFWWVNYVMFVFVNEQMISND